MKPEKIIDAMSYLDDDIIEAAEIARSRKRNPFLIKWLSLSACVVLAVLVCIPLFNRPDFINPPAETIPPTETVPPTGWDALFSFTLDDGTYIETEYNVTELPRDYIHWGTFGEGLFTWTFDEELRGKRFFRSQLNPEWVYVYMNCKVQGTADEYHDAYARFVHTSARKNLVRYNGRLYTDDILENPDITINKDRFKALKEKYGYSIRAESVEGFSEVGTAVKLESYSLPQNNLESNYFDGNRIYANPDEPEVVLIAEKALVKENGKMVQQFSVYYRCRTALEESGSIIADDLPAYASAGIYDVSEHEIPSEINLPETYAELMADEEENKKIDSLCKIRIMEVMDSGEAEKLKGWSKKWGDHNCTFYKGIILDKNFGARETGEEIIFRMPGTVEYQTKGSPPYAQGDIIAVVTLKKEETSDITRLFKSYAFVYDIFEIGGKEYAFARGQRVPELEYEYAVNHLVDESISYATTTASNPAVYYGAYEPWAIENRLSVLWREIFGLPDFDNVTWDTLPTTTINGETYIDRGNGARSELPEGYEYGGIIDSGENKGCKYYVNPEVPEWVYLAVKRFDEYDEVYVKSVHESADQWLLRYNGKLYVSATSYANKYTSLTEREIRNLDNKYGSYIKKEYLDGLVKVGTALFEGEYTIPYENCGSNYFKDDNEVYILPNEPNIIFIARTPSELAVYYLREDYFEPHPNYKLYENGQGVVRNVNGNVLTLDVGSGREISENFTVTDDTIRNGMPEIGDVVRFGNKEYTGTDYHPLTFLEITVRANE